MNKRLIRDGSTAEILRFRNDPGPMSNSVDPSSKMDGQARLALTAEPPDPRNRSLNTVYLAGRMPSPWICVGVECDKLILQL